MNEIIKRYLTTRRRTEALCQTLEVEDFVVQTAEFMSPPRWHLGHTTWLFEKILGQFLPDARPYRDDFDFYFNSYYWRFGERIERGRRGTRSRPTVRETMAYRDAVDGRMVEFLEKGLDPEPQRERDRLVRMAIEHEQQHQELLVWDILHLLGDVFQVPTLPDALRSHKDAMAFFGAKETGSLGPKHDLKPVFIEGGLFDIGWQGEDFSWDNERPHHRVFITPSCFKKSPRASFSPPAAFLTYSSTLRKVGEGFSLALDDFLQAASFSQGADSISAASRVCCSCKEVTNDEVEEMNSIVAAYWLKIQSGLCPGFAEEHGIKKNAKGITTGWIGFKLHIDTAEGAVPVACVLTSASAHDSAVAQPLESMMG